MISAVFYDISSYVSRNSIQDPLGLDRGKNSLNYNYLKKYSIAHQSVDMLLAYSMTYHVTSLLYDKDRIKWVDDKDDFPVNCCDMKAGSLIYKKEKANKTIPVKSFHYS